MNFLLLNAADLNSENCALIEIGRLTSISEIKELVINSTFKFILQNQGAGLGTVREIRATHVLLELKITSSPLPRVPITAIVGICRPQTIKKVIHVGASVGIERICFIRAALAPKSYLDSVVLSPSEIEKQIALVMQQTGDALSPQIQVHTLFNNFIQDTLPSVVKTCPATPNLLLADTTCDNTKVINKSLTSKGRLSPTFLSIGPEAGWNDYERSCFLELGFVPFSMGPRIQRVETAFALALGGLTLQEK